MISYVVGIIFLVLPFITFKLSYDAFEYPKVILFVIVINTVLALKLWSVIQEPNKYLKLNLIDKILLLLAALLIISWGVNGFPAVSFWGQYYRYEGLVTFGAYLGFYFLISRFCQSKILHLFICGSALIGAVYIAICGFLFQVLHFPIYTFYGRAAGTFGNPNFAAGFLALSFPFLLFYPKLKDIFKIIMALIFFLALAFTQSRSGLLAFFTVLIIFFIQKIKIKLILVVPIFLLVLVLLMAVIPRYSPFENQMTIWQKAVIAVGQKPLIGWSMERFDIAFISSLAADKELDLYNIRVDRAHNEILGFGVDGGIITMLVYITLLVTTFLSLLNQKQSPWFKANLFALVAYFVLSSLNVLNITEHIFLYLILASVYRKNDA